MTIARSPASTSRCVRRPKPRQRATLNSPPQRRAPPPNKAPLGTRFQQLCALASEGNDEAVADLFREFGFRYGVDEP